MQNIGSLSDFPDEGIYEINLQEQKFLLIKHDDEYSCVEDKCGHFGESLARGKVKDRKIFCPFHNISFDLNTGEIVDSMGEDCVPIRVINIIIKDGNIFCEI